MICIQTKCITASLNILAQNQKYLLTQNCSVKHKIFPNRKFFMLKQSFQWSMPFMAMTLRTGKTVYMTPTDQQIGLYTYRFLICGVLSTVGSLVCWQLVLRLVNVGIASKSQHTIFSIHFILQGFFRRTYLWLTNPMQNLSYTFFCSCIFTNSFFASLRMLPDVNKRCALCSTASESLRGLCHLQIQHKIHLRFSSNLTLALGLKVIS